MTRSGREAGEAALRDQIEARPGLFRSAICRFPPVKLCGKGLTYRGVTIPARGAPGS